MKKKILFTLSFLSLCALLFCAVGVSAEKYEVLEYSIKNNEITITDCNYFATEVTIPSEIDGVPVTAIGEGAFHGCDYLSKVNIKDISAWCNIYFHDSESNPLTYAKNLYLDGELVTDLVISDGVTEIKNYAFYGCTGLTSISIPDGATSIGHKAFSGCSALKTVDIPNSVTYIGDFGFSGCSDLLDITIPDKLTSIGAYAFENCSGLTDITIPDGVTTIEEAVFNGCTGLKSIKLPDNLTSINESAFRGCKALKNIAIPHGVTSIGNSTFDGCSGLSDISIPGKVTSIGDKAFNQCKALKNITIPDGVTSIGKHSFSDCDELTGIIIPNSVVSIGNSAFKGCGKLENITVLCSDTSIGDNAFYLCNNLTKVYITDVGAWCRISFSNIDSNPLSLAKNLYLKGEPVTELVIPDGITEIKDYAFYNCDTLKYVFFPTVSVDIGDYAFGECSNIETVFYAGNKKNWENVLKYSENETLSNATVVYNAVKKTYKFVTNCNMTLPDITDYAVFTAPTVKSEDAIFMGWYDNPALSGSPISFPYYGNATTLYAFMTSRTGTSFDHVLAMKSNQEYTVTTVMDGQLIYFEFTPRRTKEYRIHTIGSGGTCGFLYDSNRTLIESSDNDSDDFYITRTLQADETYYIVVKLNVGTGKFTLIAEEPVDYEIKSITVKDSNGNEIISIPKGVFSATVKITNISSSANTVIVLAQYTANGAFRGCKWGSVSGLSIGATFEFSASIDNKQGDIARLKAFCWDPTNSMTPLGEEVTFGKV